MIVRPATALDAELLWHWANDPLARRHSGDRPPIPWEAHHAWFAHRLDSRVALILIGESVDGEAVGAIRFESADGWGTAVLSYGVAAHARGRGFGRALLVEGVRVLRQIHPAVRIEATVAADNVPSRRLFELLDWVSSVAADGRLVFRQDGQAAA